ncbi:MAG: hotdog fold thioesterase [bacterium]|nr:hotdog fold thioesterase [bacterium]
MELEVLQKAIKGFLPGLLGISLDQANQDGVKGSLPVRDDLCTLPGILHGGAIMAFADTLGAFAAAINLPPGASTTTIESKTNFLAAGRAGTTVTGECTALHLGRRTMVWQTRVTNPDGRLIALVTQTQAVLEPRLSPEQTMASLFDGKEAGEQKELLAKLERSGAAVYRALAEDESDPQIRAKLLEAAEREEENARVLEG